jgi:hypothetical protein
MNDRQAIGKKYEAPRAEGQAAVVELKPQAAEPKSGVQMTLEGLDRGIPSAMDVFSRKSG